MSNIPVFRLGKSIKPWTVRDHEEWLKFRENCKAKDLNRCRIVNKRYCNEEDKNNCPLWYVKTFLEKN